MTSSSNIYLKGYAPSGVRYTWVNTHDMDVKIWSSPAWAYSRASGERYAYLYDGRGNYYKEYLRACDNWSNGADDRFGEFYVRITIDYIASDRFEMYYWTNDDYAYTPAYYKYTAAVYRVIPAYYAYTPAIYQYTAQKVYRPLLYQYQIV